jgi:phage recombination protein Bet
VDTNTPGDRPTSETAEAARPGGGFEDAMRATLDQATPPAVVDEAPKDTRTEEQREKAKSAAAAYGLSDVEWVVLQRTTCKDAPREIASWFMLFCNHRNLDPFSRQVYLFNDKEDKTGQWHVVTGIDGLRVIASRSPYYRGQLRPVWTYEIDETQPDGIARFDGHESKYGKIAGKRRVVECEVTVRRAIPHAPTESSLYLEFVGIARFDEFVKVNYNGKIVGNWEVQPEHQDRIRAEAMALRMGFPEEVGGIYLEDELRDRAEKDVTPAGPGTALVPADREPIDDELDALVRDLGWTKARLRIEADRAGGGKPGLLAALKAAVAERATPRGGPRGADETPPATVTETTPAATASLEECGWTTGIQADECHNEATHVEFETVAEASNPDNAVPTCDEHTGIGYGPSGEPIVARMRCAACGAKRGQEHVKACPVDETDEPAEAD